jgi:hypothetical protein
VAIFVANSLEIKILVPGLEQRATPRLFSNIGRG